jgi:hypothetical protein
MLDLAEWQWLKTLPAKDLEYVFVTAAHHKGVYIDKVLHATTQQNLASSPLGDSRGRFP